MTLINKLLAVIMSLVVIYFSFIDSNVVYLLFVLIIIIPFVVKLPPITTFVYLIYMFLAMFLGMQLHLYRKTLWFDDFAHLLWGLVSGLIGLYLIHYFKLEKQGIIFKILFTFVIFLSTSCMWEIIEYTSDSLFNSNMQRRETGVIDTMNDITYSLVGNVIYIFTYIFTHKKGIIYKITEEIGR